MMARWSEFERVLHCPGRIRAGICRVNNRQIALSKLIAGSRRIAFYDQGISGIRTEVNLCHQTLVPSVD